MYFAGIISLPISFWQYVKIRQKQCKKNCVSQKIGNFVWAKEWYVFDLRLWRWTGDKPWSYGHKSTTVIQSHGQMKYCIRNLIQQQTNTHSISAAFNTLGPDAGYLCQETCFMSWIAACLASNHYLNQCWLIVSRVKGTNLIGTKLKKNQENGFKMRLKCCLQICPIWFSLNVLHIHVQCEGGVLWLPLLCYLPPRLSPWEWHCFPCSSPLLWSVLSHRRKVGIDMMGSVPEGQRLIIIRVEKLSSSNIMSACIGVTIFAVS